MCLVIPVILGFPGRELQSPFRTAPSSELLDPSLGHRLCPKARNITLYISQTSWLQRIQFKVSLAEAKGNLMALKGQE